MNKYIFFLCLFTNTFAVPLDIDDLKRVVECRKLYLSQSIGAYLMVDTEESINAIQSIPPNINESILPLTSEFSQSPTQPRYGIYRIGGIDIKVSILPQNSIYVLWDASHDLTPTDRANFKSGYFEIQLHPNYFISMCRSLFKWVTRSQEPKTAIYETREGYTISISQNFIDKRSQNSVTLKTGRIHSYVGFKDDRHYIQPLELVFEMNLTKNEKCAPQRLDSIAIH